MNKNNELDSRKITAGLYRHYKGYEYQVIDTVYHSETQELLVLYKALYGDSLLWVRPYTMFTETVIIDGKTVPRFEFVR